MSRTLDIYTAPLMVPLGNENVVALWNFLGVRQGSPPTAVILTQREHGDSVGLVNLARPGGPFKELAEQLKRHGSVIVRVTA